LPASDLPERPRRAWRFERVPCEAQDSIVTKYIRLGTETLASKRGGEKLFYHNDHQGGVNVITNIFAVVVQLNEYDPWGKVSRSEGSAEPTKGFNGKELDAESGLYYYGGRYHDPDLARFVSADPFIQEPGNPQNFNRYSYTINNPQKYIDPSGHFFGFIFSLIFKDSTASKLFAATDPFSFLLSKIPKKVNAGFTIFGGVAMLLTGNPMGAAYIAQGGLSFGKGNGFQIASQLLGLAGAGSTLLGGSGGFGQAGAAGPGNDYPREGGGLESIMAVNALAAGKTDQAEAVRDAWGRKWRLGREVTTHPVTEKAMLRFPGFRPGADLTNVRVFTSPDIDSLTDATTINQDTILLHREYERFFYEANPAHANTLNQLLGHEFTHIVQARTVPFYFLRAPLSRWYHGYYNSPYEIEAIQAGRDFGRYMLGKP
jgi:RHS repeat-associated protein